MIRVLKRYYRFIKVFLIQISLFSKKNTEEKTYIFHHLPRCGGTSLRKSLSKSLNIYEDYRIGWSKVYNKPYNLNKFGINDCLAGHFESDGFRLLDRYPQIKDNKRYFLFTFIRDPFQIAISDYFYSKKMGAISLNTKLEEFLDEKNNYLAQILDLNFDNYKKKLKRYNYIGICEKYSKSLDHLKKSLNIKDLNENKLNEAKRKDINRFKNTVLKKFRESFSKAIFFNKI